MGNRAGQRRHRLATTGVGGKRQVPPAVDLGPLPCAALVQEPDNQERLDDHRAGRAQHRGPVFAPQTGPPIENEAVRRQPALRDPPSLQLAPVEFRLTWRLWRRSDATGAVPFKSRLATSAVLRLRKSLELVLEHTMPELAKWSGPQHHKHLPGLGQHLQDLVHESRVIVVNRDGSLVLANDASRRNRSSTAASRSGVSGKSCCRYLRANTAAGPPTVTMRSGFGRSAKVDSM
jgi:hypothetical protein